MTLDESDQTLKCYFDGYEYSIGSNPVAIIASSLEKITEVTIGYSTLP
jgi:hypothetical protein